MAWFRFDDSAIDHPKILSLSDGAFRLWVEGGAFCTRHLTDGLILATALKGFRYAKPGRVQELAHIGLWDRVQTGYQMHDFLEWNESRESVLAKRKAGRERLNQWREKRSPEPVSNAVTNSDSNTARNAHIAYGVVLDSSSGISVSSEGEPERKPSLPERRPRNSGRIFLHRWQQDALIDIIGPHVDTFPLDEFLDNLNAQLASVALPRDPWKFVQAELHSEFARRGLAVAQAVPEPPPMNKRIAGIVAGGEAFLRMRAEARARGEE